MKNYRFNLIKKKNGDHLSSVIAFIWVLLIFLDIFQIAFCVYSINKSIKIKGMSTNITLEEKKIVQEATELNKVLPDVSFRMGSLFSSLEKILPDNSRIRQIEVNKNGNISLSGECKTNIELKILFERLSKSPFGSVKLEKQGFKKDLLYFTLRCDYEG